MWELKKEDKHRTNIKFKNLKENNKLKKLSLAKL